MRNEASQKGHHVTEQVWDKAIAADPGNSDLKYAKTVFLGVTDKQIRETFVRSSQSAFGVTDDLYFMPDHLFNYYFHHFNEFILSKEYDRFDADMILDCYVGSLNNKLDSSSVNDSHPLEQTKQTLDFIGKNIEYFFGETKIYGNPRKSVAELQKRFYKILQKEGLRP